MSSTLARPLLSKAVKKIAEEKGVSPKLIAIVVHQKVDKEDNMSCGYYLAVNNKPEKDENGNIKPLNFRKDILRKTMDMLGYEHIVGNFLIKKILLVEELYSEQEFKAEDLEFLIMPQSEQVIDFNVLLCHKRKFIRKYTLDEIFEIG